MAVIRVPAVTSRDAIATVSLLERDNGLAARIEPALRDHGRKRDHNLAEFPILPRRTPDDSHGMVLLPCAGQAVMDSSGSLNNAHTIKTLVHKPK